MFGDMVDTLTDSGLRRLCPAQPVDQRFQQVFGRCGQELEGRRLGLASSLDSEERRGGGIVLPDLTGNGGVLGSGEQQDRIDPPVPAQLFQCFFGVPRPDDLDGGMTDEQRGKVGSVR